MRSRHPPKYIGMMNTRVMFRMCGSDLSCMASFRPMALCGSICFRDGDTVPSSSRLERTRQGVCISDDGYVRIIGIGLDGIGVGRFLPPS
jgi:hypothetical protein